MQLDFFAENKAAVEDKKKSAEATAIMDELNKKYGQNSNQQAAVFITSKAIKNKQSW